MRLELIIALSLTVFVEIDEARRHNQPLGVEGRPSS